MKSPKRARRHMFSSFFAAPPQLSLTVQFCVEPDEGGYHAFSPLLKGLHADGETEDEAARNFVEVIPAYIESLAKHGEPLPVGMVVTVSSPEEATQVPTGAFLKHVREVTLSWPSMETSGIS
jgi:predicted RNase H-like HicB family nuclease